MEKLIGKYNKELYNNGYNKNMISTKEAFIKYYQDFLKENHMTGLHEILESAIKKVKESKETHVVDCLLLDNDVEVFSTVDELDNIMNGFSDIN